MTHAYTGLPGVDDLIENSHAILLYGPAGAGKTSILVEISGNLCRIDQCIYITTEETLHYERVSRNIERYEKALFAEAYDMDTLLKTAIATYFARPKYIFLDSVNALFRLEAMKEDALTKQALIISLLIETTQNVDGKVFASAQVRTGLEGSLEIPGESIVEYYFDTIFMITINSDGKRFIKPVKAPVKPSFDHAVFKITETGVEWEHEH